MGACELVGWAGLDRVSILLVIGGLGIRSGRKFDGLGRVGSQKMDLRH